MMERPAIIIAFVLIVAIIVFLLINLIKYNWKNGELKTRLLFMAWAIFKMLHIRAMYYHQTHGWWMLLSLGAILAILLRHYLKRPNEDIKVPYLGGGDQKPDSNKTRD